MFVLHGKLSDKGLGAFWRETGPPLNMICGEDVHFAYSVQKHLGKPYYFKYGTGSKSISSQYLRSLQGFCEKYNLQMIAVIEAYNEKIQAEFSA